ncbi:MAG: PEP/pyruvate-binding domain-containing protein, partial [Patescibacteria group bacterium]
MIKEKRPVLWFKEVEIKDVPLVGGKNAALGEMYGNLTPLGINIPNGFAITAHAYREFINKTGLRNKIREILRGLNTHSMKDLQRRGKAVRSAILGSELPENLREEIKKAYEKLGKIYFHNPDVAVRSSATAEDLPGA